MGLRSLGREVNHTAGPARLLVGGPWGWSLGGSRARLLLELRAAGSGRPSVAGPGLGERLGRGLGRGRAWWTGLEHPIVGPAVPEMGWGAKGGGFFLGISPAFWASAPT